MSGKAGSIVILGGGHAAVSVMGFLRQNGWTGKIHLISNEERLPYQRPPLSKSWLQGALDASDLDLRPEKFYTEQSIDVRLNVSAERIDSSLRRVVLSDGTSLHYSHLIIAVGAKSRRLAIPGASLGRVFELRSVTDADRFKAVMQSGARLAIVGGGYVGLEVAAASIALGVKPTVIERESRLLARVASNEIAQFVARHHRANNVILELDAAVEALEGAEGRVAAVRLAGGRYVACDMALVCVGIIPDDDLARQAGLVCKDGIVVDQEARTSDRCVYAIGDCSSRPIPFSGGLGRLQSVPSAVEQARQAAASICGRSLPPSDVPWFWSDQFGLKLRMAGIISGAVESVVRTDTSDSFSIFHLSADRRVKAVESVNAPSDFMAGKQMISRAQAVSPARLGDMAIHIKDVAA